jgi:hypothetical protein
LISGSTETRSIRFGDSINDLRYKRVLGRAGPSSRLGEISSGLETRGRESSNKNSWGSSVDLGGRGGTAGLTDDLEFIGLGGIGEILTEIS